ncbi:hypothetical protein MTP99_007322 [Tenebrio molitor]|nr:hypothetical protein MTP99_007322 [Tenebrio molitor]
MEELEAMAGLLDVLDEFPECGTDYNSETTRLNKSIEITASYALMRYRQMTQGQLELENREIPHAAAARARGE